MILSIDDFKVKSLYQISTDRFTVDELQWYIDTYEKEYLIKLLGCDLYNLFVADLVDREPTTQRFIDIFNPICEDQGSGCLPIVTHGIKDMLMGFVYFHYVREQQKNNTITGNVQPSNELSKQSLNSELAGILSIRYNRATETAEGVRDFVIKYDDVYPEYMGQKFKYLGLGGMY